MAGEKLAKALRRAQRYAVALLGEEGCEIGQIAGKVGRFGLDSRRRDGSSAADLLHEEVGDLLAARDYAVMAGLLDPAELEKRRALKLAKLLNPKSRTAQGKRLAPPIPAAAG